MLGLSEIAQTLLSGVELFRGIANGVLDLANGFLSVAEAFTNGKHNSGWSNLLKLLTEMVVHIFQKMSVLYLFHTKVLQTVLRVVFIY